MMNTKRRTRKENKRIKEKMKKIKRRKR